MKYLQKYLQLAFITVCIFLPAFSQAQSGSMTETDQIKQAQKFFDDKDYAKALPVYSQIVSNQPENAVYNYRLGVCLLKVDGDKADAVRFLSIAVKSAEVPDNAWLYLGMALHQAYRYDEAITALQTFRKNAGKQSWRDSGGDELMQMCQNAINLNNDLSLTRHSILAEQESNCADITASYKNIASSGRFLKLPKDYESKQSKEKPECSLLFLAASGDKMVFSGPGKNGDTGLDIFIVKKDNKGLWLFPEPVSTSINSQADEAYPVLVNEGKTIYFSSKGNKSTGGYDVFRSDYDNATAKWSEPVAMGSPVNSPGNDYYYVPMADKITAYFSSDRESPSGKCKVYTASIITDDRNFAAINGTFVCPAGLDLSDTKVTILNFADRSMLAQFRTATQNGTYFLKLPVPSKLVFQVKLPGFNDLESEVVLDDAGQFRLIQEILVKRDAKGIESVRITTKAAEVMPEMMVKNAQISDSAPQQMAANKPLAESSPSQSAREPLVSIVNTETKEVAANIPEKNAESAKTESALPLVSIVNTETKEVAAITPDKNAEPAKTESALPLVSIVNTETKEVAAITSEKNAEPAKTESALPLVSIVNTETKEVAAITPDKKTEPAKTESALPLVSIVNSETREVAAVTAGKKSEPSKVNVPMETTVSGTVNAEANLPEEGKRKSKRSRHEVKDPVMVEAPVALVAATPVKPTLQDVIFKVQLGAFRDRTEAELKKKYEATGIKNVEFLKNSEGLLVVVTGNESDYLSATKLKETAIQKGLKDAFVVVYSGDNRLPVSMVVFEDEE